MSGVDASAVPALEKFPHGSGFWAVVLAFLMDRERQEFDMSDTLDWNAKTIAEFRANEGRVGGNFEGAPLVLVHHRGRKSGRDTSTR